MNSINEYFHVEVACIQNTSDVVDETYRDIERERSVDSLCWLQWNWDGKSRMQQKVKRKEKNKKGRMKVAKLKLIQPWLGR